MDSDATNEAEKSQAADAMILELEALMADVDKAQRSLDTKKQKQSIDDGEASMAMGEENGAGECPMEIPAEGNVEMPVEGKPDAEALFRELEGLTSMMDSVTQSLINAREGANDVGGGEEPAASPFEIAISPPPEDAVLPVALTPDSSISAFLHALGDLSGGTPLEVPPPEPVATEPLEPPTVSPEQFNDHPTTNEKNESLTEDIDSLPLTTSFMSSNGALPLGATAVDFNPLYGSAAASLTVSQMSNEGLASSVEGLNMSQISNEGMATSAIIDATEFTVASPQWESSKNDFESGEPQSNVDSVKRDTVDASPEAGVVESNAEISEAVVAASAETLSAAAPTSAVKVAAGKKKSSSPMTTSSTSTSSSKSSSMVSAAKTKKSKKASSPLLAAVNGDLTEVPPVPKETPENVLRNLHNFQSVEAKLEELTVRHATAVTQNREMEAQVKLEQRRTLASLKEKELLSVEHQKAILAKSKLESLCRELQKHSKMIKDEAMKRAQIEETKRKEVADSFQSTIDEVTSRMQHNSERNNALRDQNEELASKMKHLVDQYEQREDHIDKILKHKDLEQQLVQAKLDKAEAEKKELLEKSTRERELLLAQTLEAVKKNQMLEQNEKHLRAQIELYTEKYDEFQSTLSKSNTVFNNFKSEMAQMTKKIKKLEKEIQMWKGRWETSNTALEKVTKEKEGNEVELKEARSKANKLEKLCRALQQERHSLSSQMSQLQLGKDALGNDVPNANVVVVDTVDNVGDIVD